MIKYWRRINTNRPIAPQPAPGQAPALAPGQASGLVPGQAPGLAPGQATVEYVLLLATVIAIFLAFVKNIRPYLDGFQGRVADQLEQRLSENLYHVNVK